MTEQEMHQIYEDGYNAGCEDLRMIESLNERLKQEIAELKAENTELKQKIAMLEYAG